MSNKYSEYQEVTQRYLFSIEQYLKAKFGTIQSQWESLLDILAQQFDLYILSKEAIKANGIIIDAGRAGTKANPAIKVSNDAIIQIEKIFSELGLSPKAELKLRELSANDEGESDFLKKLMGD